MTSATENAGAAVAEDDQDEAPRAGRLTNLVCGAVVTALGAGALYVALDLDLGSLSRPRAGTWPAIVSTVLLVCGALIMVRSAHFADAERITRNGYRVVAAVIGLVAVAQLIPLVGFEIPSFVLLVAWMSLMERERLRLSVPVALVTVATFYLVFIQALAVPLPRLF
ncbi:tripartite tricarboxylate transporter TctB family protein [Nocardiopsis sp. Huas11]|uniref:tripartite tricarboxylate transporter TctB family protein n=1 Tax=Nocardiopsis sp. Huas11 TaxID=2183912 RepID=UPI000EB1B1E8|nr:tripartite tricarboxylate transporter TctB family protein [Nocardiopsis sp. Huas11]RKS07458.1 tripartite tricarboxylate transporter TctB family protein [Nocardiopsis sp. Huas11]